jgi:aminopeptidase YwaD
MIKTMNKKQTSIFLFAFIPALALADLTALIPESTIAAIADETSGVAAKRNLDTVTLYHRTRAGSQFRQAAEHVLARLQAYGFEDAGILEYPADGKTMFGTQKSRFAWDVDFAELWELDGDGQRVTRHGSWEALPLSVAQDSVSGKVRTALVDIGAGTSDGDYAGKDLAGRLVLTSSQPEVVAERAVGELGAAGIISYAPNQKSAWWKEDDRLVRWGHLDGFKETQTFAFMISLGVARQLQARLAAGEEIVFDAEIRAHLREGRYALVSAVIPGAVIPGAAIPGADPALAAEEIVYSCHLDHPRPGANDNASGCVSILEAARVLNRLITLGALPPPRRSLRFIWPAEIEGSIIYLSSLDSTAHIKANIHLDMVGGGAATKSVFRISGGPMSLPTFIADVGHEIGHFVNDQTERYASGEDVPFPLVSVEGSKNPQLALMEGIDLGSDHQVFNEGSFGIPGIYLHDWPDRYIHTNFDQAANIDPTKLKRAAFIAALQGWYLANFDGDDVAPVLALLQANAMQRARELMLELPSLSVAQQAAVLGVHWEVERRKVASLEDFASLSGDQKQTAGAFIAGLSGLMGTPEIERPGNASDDRVYRRNTDIKGPMHAFGYSYIEDHLPADEYAGLKLSGVLAYEALNLVDGKRTVGEIRHWLLAECRAQCRASSGWLEPGDVAAYLAALEKIGVVLQESR